MNTRRPVCVACFLERCRFSTAFSASENHAVGGEMAIVPSSVMPSNEVVKCCPGVYFFREISGQRAVKNGATWCGAERR